ncbi:MAG: hypothetical protein ACE5KR_00790 [Candidatus Bipolaricaulia bacterium]
MALARENPQAYEEWLKDHGAESFEEHGRLIQEEEARQRGDELASSPRGGTVASLRRGIRKRKLRFALFRLRMRRLLHSVPWPALLQGLGLLFGDLRSWEEGQRAYRRWKRARRESWKKSIQKLRRLPPRRDSYEQWKREVGLSLPEREGTSKGT